MNELRHYGVKGMKWGIRKDRESSVSNTSKTVDGMPLYRDKDGSYYLPRSGNTNGYRVWKDGTITSEGKVVSFGSGGGGVSDEDFVVDKLSPEEEEFLEKLQEMTDTEYNALSPEERAVIEATKEKISAFLKAKGNSILYSAIKTERKVAYVKNLVIGTIEAEKKRWDNTKRELNAIKNDKVNKFLKRGQYAQLKVDKNGRIADRPKTAKQASPYKGATSAKGFTSRTTMKTVKGTTTSRDKVKKKKKR